MRIPSTSRSPAWVPSKLRRTSTSMREIRPLTGPAEHVRNGMQWWKPQDHIAKTPVFSSTKDQEIHIDIIIFKAKYFRNMYCNYSRWRLFWEDIKGINLPKLQALYSPYLKTRPFLVCILKKNSRFRISTWRSEYLNTITDWGYGL